MTEVEKLKADVEALVQITAELTDALKYAVLFNDNIAAERKRKNAEAVLLKHFIMPLES